jgi:hypothetical protein
MSPSITLWVSSYTEQPENAIGISPA